MNYRIGGVNQPVVIVARQAKLRGRDIAPKNSHPCLQLFVKSRELQMQLQRPPQPCLGLMGVSGANEHIQRRSVLFQEIRGDMAADVSGGTGQEYRHVAPFVPVLMVLSLSSPCVS